jgi:hypothetical protein
MQTQSYPGCWQVGNRTVSVAYALTNLSKVFYQVFWAMRKAQVPASHLVTNLAPGMAAAVTANYRK